MAPEGIASVAPNLLGRPLTPLCVKSGYAHIQRVFMVAIKVFVNQPDPTATARPKNSRTRLPSASERYFFHLSLGL